MNLRPYQQECLNSIPDSGRYLIQMATGCGKTVTFSRIPRRGRMLIVSHREELTEQPRKYFDCSFGIERAENSSNGEEVVSASVQTLHRRLNRFNPNEFDIVIIDEAHHAAGETYQRIIKHFNPRLLLGFTATPNRSDGIGLDKTFDKIIFEYDIETAIKEKYLSDIHCIRANVGFNLDGVKTKLGDFDNKELERELIERKVIEATAEAYYKYAVGQTLIFACSVKHAEEISDHIDGSSYITGKTKNRHLILDAFTRKYIKCIVNCGVFTEGTDLPCIETIIMARPTKSQPLYVQCVGRGTRLFQGKDKLTLIDCVGVTGRHSLCSAATLLGVDTSSVYDESVLEGDIFSLPEKAIAASDCPESWIKNVKVVELFAKERGYFTHNVNYFKMPDGTMIVKLPDRKWFRIMPINKIGFTSMLASDGRKRTNIKAQEAFDLILKTLRAECMEYQYIWDLSIAKKWGAKEASEKQKELILKKLPNYDVSTLTKLEAGCILNRLFMH